MRYLVLLRGSPGVGKSTWIKENNLEDYTISSDKLRILIQSPALDIYGNPYISQTNDSKVWGMVYALCEERMKRGELIIVDATHSRSQFINNYRELCQKFRYRCLVINFTEDLETILERNFGRDPLKRVPENAVRLSYSRIETQKLPGWCVNKTPPEFLEMLKSESLIFDFSKYEKIHVIGDIHGCYQPLAKYFTDSMFQESENEFVIFVGDYFDRGIQNVDVFNFLYSIKNNKNVLLLEGNHERHLRAFVNDEKVVSLYARRTIQELTQSGITKSQIRQLTQKLAQFAYFRYNNSIYLVTHGGMPVLPTIKTPTQYFIDGVGRYEDMDLVAESWNSNTPPNYYQIFGHRNIDLVNIEIGRCFNLCDRVEYGGTLRILTLSKDNINSHYVSNYIFSEQDNDDNDIDLSSPTLSNEDIISKMMASRNVTKKRINGNIYSLNFSRDVFSNKKWNGITSKARGLFVDIVENKIIARSYEKFFNLNEVAATRVTALKRSLQFPVSVYVKENGFLGLISSHEGKPFIATKSTTGGNYAGYFRDIISTTGFDIEYANKFCKEINVTLVFEVVDPINDPHIIGYNKQEIFLLDIVTNEFDYKLFGYETIATLSRKLKCNYKDKIHGGGQNGDFDNWSNFYEWLYGVENNFDDKSEGYVVVDSSGFMFKIKTPYYKFWKEMRWLRDRFARGSEIKTQTLTSVKANEVFAWMRTKPREYFNKSIIEIREDYEKGVN